MGKLLQTIGYTMGKCVGALILGAVILWQVVEHIGPTNRQALVHVTTIHVDVTVDDAMYRIESLEQTPIVCELRPGRHKVRMVREGQVLYEEEFAIAAGEELILTAWNPYDDGRSPMRSREIPPGHRLPLDPRRNYRIVASSRH
jgi:hypothetical protein